MFLQRGLRVYVLIVCLGCWFSAVGEAEAALLRCVYVRMC